MNQRRVLIVDDDPALLQALPEALRLRMESVMVDTADSPEFQSKSTHYIRFPLSGACDSLKDGLLFLTEGNYAGDLETVLSVS